MKIKKKYLSSNPIIFLCELVILCASFDIVGVINVFGFTFRISQIFILISFIILIKINKFKISKNSVFFVIWLFLQFVFIFNSPKILFSIGYFGWLVLDVLIIVIFCNIFDTQKRIILLMRVFLSSFLIMALLGLVQWILGIVGINFYLTQVTLHGSIFPRINGFTYEPSYYSTYLLPGWILSIYLYENGSEIFSKLFLKKTTIIITFALLLCTSRMGWLFMGAWAVFRFIVFCLFSKSSKTKKQLYFIFITIIVFIVAIIFMYYITKTRGIELLFAGLGIANSSSHSSGARLDQLNKTIAVFLKHPLVGVSLGGVPAEYCILNDMSFDTGASMCVWIEVLAASGIIGIIPFVISAVLFLGRTINTLKRTNFWRNELKGLLYALLFEILILAMNQNILRIYFWVLLAVFCAVLKFMEKENKL